jgi:hypothetical protein
MRIFFSHIIWPFVTTPLYVQVHICRYASLNNRNTQLARIDWHVCQIKVNKSSDPDASRHSHGRFSRPRRLCFFSLGPFFGCRYFYTQMSNSDRLPNNKPTHTHAFLCWLRLCVRYSGWRRDLLFALLGFLPPSKQPANIIRKKMERIDFNWSDPSLIIVSSLGGHKNNNDDDACCRVRWKQQQQQVVVWRSTERR